MAEIIYDGGPAFPSEQGQTSQGWNQTFTPGMCLRDYFAAHVQADDRLVKAIRAMDDAARRRAIRVEAMQECAKAVYFDMDAFDAVCELIAKEGA